MLFKLPPNSAMLVHYYISTATVISLQLLTSLNAMNNIWGKYISYSCKWMFGTGWLLCIERVALGSEKSMLYRFKLSLSWNICWHPWSKPQHACQLETHVWTKFVQWFSCVVYLHCLYNPLPRLIFTRSGMSTSQESQYRWDQSIYI